jgi:aspartate 4-decarboxylase
LLRDELLEYAAECGIDYSELLDGSRGTSNWQQRDILNAWHTLGMYVDFAIETVPGNPSLRALWTWADIDHAARFAEFAAAHACDDDPLHRGVRFLEGVWDYLERDALAGTPRGAIIAAFADAMRASNYAKPPTLAFVQPVLTRYLAPLLFEGNKDLAAQFDVYMFEGATTGAAVAAQSLVRAGLLKPGDKVALLWPSYEPFQDLFCTQHGLEAVHIWRDPANDWEPCPGEFEKLLDPAVKVYVSVSPGNPVPVTASAKAIAELKAVAEKRPDLLIFSDHVYAHFLDEPLDAEIKHLPRQTLAFYSLSKDFALAGARAGVMLVHKDTVIDDMLAARDPEQARAADAVYATRASDVMSFLFIRRVAVDSRWVSFSHMSGMATPIQALVCLAAAFDGAFPEESKAYFKWVAETMKSRLVALYDALGLPVSDVVRDHSSRYSALLDLRDIARAHYGEEGVARLEVIGPTPVFRHIVKQYRAVVVPGQPFGGSEYSFRVCLPFLTEAQYRRIGESVKSAVDDVVNAER